MSSASPTIAEENEFDPLLQQVRFDLYQINAFRVIGINVDAGPREIARHFQKLEMQQKYGATAAPTNPLPLSPAPNIDSLREAQQRLNDPQVRLLDEFFWFWPTAGHIPDGGDEGLALLLKNDIPGAVESWKPVATPENGVAAHNLAVLLHLRAVEHTRLTRESCPEDWWTEAYSCWKGLADSDGFWDLVRQRIHRLDDPRLPITVADSMRRSLPAALLSIHAELAVAVANRGDSAQAERLRRIMLNSEFQGVGAALDRALKAIRERITALCDAATASAGKDPEHADEACMRLMTDARPLLATLDCLLPVVHPAREGAHDAVALRVLACQDAFANKTENWTRCVEVLEAAVPLATGDSTREKMQQAVEITAKARQNQAEYGVCWFCRQNKPADKANYDIKLYGNVQQSGNRMQWQNKTLSIPRCITCNNFHQRDNNWRVIGGGVGLLMTLGSCAAVRDSNAGAAFFWLGFALVLIGSYIGHLVARSTTPNTIKPFNHGQSHPSLQRAILLGGWRIGAKPPNVK
jgi:hypothetical protein